MYDVDFCSSAAYKINADKGLDQLPPVYAYTFFFPCGNCFHKIDVPSHCICTDAQSITQFGSVWGTPFDGFGAFLFSFFSSFQHAKQMSRNSDFQWINIPGLCLSQRMHKTFWAKWAASTPLDKLESSAARGSASLQSTNAISESWKKNGKNKTGKRCHISI